MADEDVVKLPSQRILSTLVRLTNQTKEKVGLASGELGQAIKDAAEKQNLHPAAFKLVAKLRRMDAVKLNGFLTHFDDYRAKLKLDDLKATDLPGMEERTKTEDDDKIASKQGLRSIDGGKDVAASA